MDFFKADLQDHLGTTVLFYTHFSNKARNFVHLNQVLKDSVESLKHPCFKKQLLSALHLRLII